MSFKISRNQAKDKGKLPVQARSKELVDSLLVSATRILETNDLDETSTNQIAETAGASIGSLYQYFPNKETLASAVMARLLFVRTDFNRQIDSLNANTDIRQIVEIYLDYFFSHVIKNRKLIRNLGKHIFRIRQFENLIQTRMIINAGIKETICSRKLASTEEAEAISRVIVAAVAGVLESIIFIDYSPQEIEKIRAVTSQMIRAYLATLKN